MKKRLVIEIEGGVLQSVYGDRIDGVELDIILRDMDNIAAGDPDPEEEMTDTNDMVTYW